MGRKGMKGFMKSASRSANKPEEEEAQQPADKVAPVQQPPSNSATTDHSNGKQSQSKESESRAAGAEEQLEDEGDSKQETRGQMLQRHKREVLAHKKAVQRMGKKSKDELAKLDAEIEARHAKELQQLEAASSDSSAAAAASSPAAAAQVASAVDGSADAADKASKYLKELSVGDAEVEDVAKAGKKPTKAQKRREKQAAKEAEREARIAAEQEALGPSEREEEEKALKALLQPLGLGIKEIRADGNCLYRSVEHQLTVSAAAAEKEAEEQQNGDAAAVPDHQRLRELAAKYIREHKDDFAPFLLPEDESEDFDTHFEQYCTILETTAAWGGHLELQALSHALRRQIKVHAVGMSTQTLGDEYAGDDKPPALEICYLRHAFGLGEHYNSTRQKRFVRFSTEHEYYEHEGPIPSSPEDTGDESDSDEDSSEQ